MNFGVISLPQLNKHSLGSLNFPRGIIVFLLGLVFFLGSTEQYKAMEVGITFFESKLDLLCISKVLTIFCVFSKVRRKRKRSRGHVACSPSAQGDFSVWALGRAAHSESTREGSLGSATRDTWRAQVHPGFSWVSLGTRVALEVFQGKYHSLDSWCTRGLPGGSVVNGYSGHVSTRATSGETLPFVVLGTRGALAGFRGKYHSLDFTAHSGASGRVAAHSEAFGEACGALGDRCRAPKVIPRGFEGAFGWFPGHVAFLRKVPKEVPSEASKGAFGRASGRLRRDFRDTRHAPKGSERGCFGVARPEGVFEGGCEGVFRKACSE